MNTRLIAAIIISCGIVSMSFATDDWPGWRGSKRNDISQEKGLLQEWPKDGPKKLWGNENAGLGYAGFSVVGGKLFTLGLFDNEEFGLCIDANTGKEVWRIKVGEKFKNGWGDGPRNTPTVDGNNVFFLSAKGTLSSVNIESGKANWSKEMTELGGKVPFWGYAESPLIDGDKLICTPGGEKGAIAALNKTTGEVLWQTEDLKQIAHYSSIIKFEKEGKACYVQLLVDKVVGVNPENGDVLWQVDFPGRTAVIPTPVDVDGNIYVTSGYGAGSSLIKVKSDGSAEEAWHDGSMSNHHGGVIFLNGHIYGHSDKAGFSCQAIETGKLTWSEEKELKKGSVSYADGRFYYLQEDNGAVVLLSATPEGWDEKGRFKLEPQSKQRNPQGKIWVHPVIANGKLYLRDQEFIMCYDIRKADKP